MKTIDFYGPYHFNDIDPKTGEIINNSSNIPNPNLPGIYIWGFMYSYNNFGLAAPINNKNVMPQYNKGSMQFIPYYVGIRKSRIFSRIKEHNEIGNINKPNSSAHKFTRLSPNYMTKFLMMSIFPMSEIPKFG
ncbi:MAG: hypothetical protein IPI65_05715 [Bacteroidetes bacterium]|nr:hypothetical protein [Bacteroidota bacterium]